MSNLLFLSFENFPSVVLSCLKDILNIFGSDLTDENDNADIDNTDNNGNSNIPDDNDNTGNNDNEEKTECDHRQYGDNCDKCSLKLFSINVFKKIHYLTSVFFFLVSFIGLKSS